MNRAWFGRAAGWVSALALSVPFAAGQEALEVRPEAMMAWEVVAFGALTAYRLVDADATGVAHGALVAECSGQGASGRISEQRVDLAATPVLEWRWRLDQGFAGVDERTRAGDDHAARIYLVHERWPRWRSRVVNYVFSSDQPAGESWPNPFSDRFAMLAVAGRDAPTGQWRTERRDVREDFRRLHGIDIDNVDAIAIMTDCDNTGQPARAAYGPMRWLPAGPR